MNVKLTKVTAPIARFGSRMAFKARKNAPLFLMIGGITTGVAAVISACKATTKAGDILDEFSAKKEEIHKMEAAAKESNTEYDAGRDMLLAYKDLVGGMAKLYGPTIALEAVSVACALCSYKVLNGRHLGAITAYTALDERFKRYRKRNAEKIGAEAEEELYSGIKKETVLVKGKDPETGEDVFEDKEVYTAPKDFETPSYWDMVFCSEESTAYQPGNRWYNETYLYETQNLFETKLVTEGHVFLSDVLKKLGMYNKLDKERKIMSRQVGWIYNGADEPTNFIDFGVKKLYQESGDHIYPTGKVRKEYSEWVYYLHFNIDGLIWDKIE